MRWVRASLHPKRRLLGFGRVARLATIAVVLVPVVLLLLLRRLSLSPYGSADRVVLHRPSALTLTVSRGDDGDSRSSASSLPFTLAAEWSLGESVSVRGLYWLDVNGDGCLDLLIDSQAADSLLLLNRRRCWEPGDDAAQFRVVSEPAVGLQWPRSDGSDATSTLITDVDGDEAVDVCRFRCGCGDTDDSDEDDRGAAGGKTAETAEAPQSAAACDFRCSLQCAVNTAARSDSASTRFTLLDPIPVPTASPVSSPSSSLTTSLLAVDWNEDGVVDVLLHSSSSPLRFSSFSLHAVNLPPALPNTAGAAALARVLISYEWPPPAPRIPVLCLRAAQPDSDPAAAAATPALASLPCLVAAAERRVLMMRPPAAERSLAAAEAAKNEGSSGCQQLLVAELDDMSPTEIVCIGSLFPSQVRVFQPGRGSNGVGIRTGWHQRPAWAVDSQKQQGAEAQLAVRQACLGDYNSDLWPDYVLASDRVVLATAMRDYGADRSFIAYRRTVLSAPAAASGSVLSVSCLDLDNDGDLDILAVHEDEQGRALPVLYYNNKTSTGIRFFAVMAMPVSAQQGARTGGKAASGAAGAVGVVVGDFDRDGWLDFAIGHHSGAVQLYRNSRRHSLGQDAYGDIGGQDGQEPPARSLARPHANHWLQVDVHGKHRSCAGAAATVQLTLDSGRRRQSIFAASGGSSFAAVQTQHQPWLHFGLGQHAMLDRLSVSWPSRALKLTDLTADQHLQLLGPYQNKPVPEPLLPMFRGYGFAEREQPQGGCVRPGWQRLRPSLFILGMAKCGTTSLSDALAAHPLVLQPSAKELHYFPHLHADLPAERWYQPHFPCGNSSRHVTFDASTHYLYEPAVPAQLLGLYPTARLIVVLRDPVSRAFSHYRMSHRNTENPALRMNASAADFHSRAEAWIAGFNGCVSRQLEMAEKDAVGGWLDAAHDACSYDYAHREFSSGLYSVLLLRWLPLLRHRSPFPLLLIALEQLYREPAPIINFVFSSVLGLPERKQPLLPRTNTASDGIEPMWPQTERLLRAFYGPFNLRLSALLPFHQGYVPDWLGQRRADQAGKGDSDSSARAEAAASLDQVEGEE